MRTILFFLILAAVAMPPVQAQFAPPSGGCPPGMHLEGFSCVYDQPAQQPSQTPEAPAQWHSYSAAVAWADSDTGSKFIGVSKHFDEQSARETALQKCQASGWRNCAVATSVVDGVIVIARDSNRNLGARVATTESEARDGIKAKCREAAVTCEVLAVFDGTPEYF